VLRTYFRQCLRLCLPTSFSAWIGWYFIFTAVELGLSLILFKQWVLNYRDFTSPFSLTIIAAACILPLIALLGFRLAFVAPYRLFCTWAESGARNKFPQSSIVRTREDSYCIMIAVAGFNRDELTITEHEQALFVAGRKADAEPDVTGEYPRGHFGHPFEKRFNLGPEVQVKAASLENGLLRIEIHEQLEPKRPRRIDIRPPLRLPGNQAKIVERAKIA
jgi:molecular chaperone IbpA